jgi:hypothetical protein
MISGGGSSKRGGRRADQGALVGFGSDETAPKEATKMRPVGFFGDSMPRTAVLDKAVLEDGEAVAVVEEPEDPSLQPVTIAEINEGARGA